MEDHQFRTWKQHLVPFLYDWITNHNLTWPSQTCRWGPKIEDSPHKTKYRLYISEQTDGSEPQKITICTADIFKPRSAGPEAVSNWSEFSKSPYVKEQKVIFHPGEVNKIRELPQHPNIIVTHTDAPELFVWNVEKQPARQKKEEKQDKRSRITDSVADLQLVGHKDNAQFPLATCSNQPIVASGGTDHLVLTWNLQDSMETVLAGSSGTKHAPTLQANQTLLGHSDTVEDVVFKPGTSQQLASVGDDHLFLLWDTRSGARPVTQVEAAHGSHDIHCVDWSALQEEFIATGAADGSLKIWDLRKLGGTNDYLYNFDFHGEATMRVEWHPTARGILASGGDDKIVAVWNLNATSSDAASQSSSLPPQLMFQHLGHKNGKVVDFQWNSSDTWLLMSVSDDTDGGAGGGTLQMWRINDMIYRPEDEVVPELEADREFILTGKQATRPSKAAADITTNGSSASTPKAEPPAEPPVAAAPTAVPPQPTTVTPPTAVGEPTVATAPAADHTQVTEQATEAAASTEPASAPAVLTADPAAGASEQPDVTPGDTAEEVMQEADKDVQPAEAPEAKDVEPQAAEVAAGNGSAEPMVVDEAEVGAHSGDVQAIAAEGGASVVKEEANTEQVKGEENTEKAGKVELESTEPSANPVGDGVAQGDVDVTDAVAEGTAPESAPETVVSMETEGEQAAEGGTKDQPGGEAGGGGGGAEDIGKETAGTDAPMET